MSLAEFPQLKALSIREKLELADELWRDASQGAETMAVTQEEKDLLDSRWEEFLTAPQAALSVDQFREQLRIRRR